MSKIFEAAISLTVPEPSENIECMCIEPEYSNMKLIYKIYKICQIIRLSDYQIYFLLTSKVHMTIWYIMKLLHEYILIHLYKYYYLLPHPKIKQHNFPILK